MCRGFQENEREKLKIRAFYTQLSVLRAKNAAAAAVPPDFLTLHFVPRINGALLEINGSRIRSDAPAFVTLHRVISEENNAAAGRGFKYGSRERITACEGAKFEIYAGDMKVLKGIFRKDEGDNWKMECKCPNGGVVKGVEGAEVTVAAEGLGGVMSEKVEVAAAAGRMRRRRGVRCCELEEIPEVREEESGSGACCCSECGGGEAVDDGGGDCEVEVDVEAVNWAVDVGIWAVCLGVGCLVSASSYNRFRRKRFV